VFTITRDENTAAKVLGKIEEVYGLKSNFKIRPTDNAVRLELIVGLQYEAADRELVKYELNRNVIANSLVFTSEDDKQVRVKVTSRQEDGKVLTSQFRGDSEGDTKELQIPGLTQAQVEAYARRLYEESKVDSFEGSMTTFGLPKVTTGALVNIATKDFELKETTNYVDEVSTTIGVNGFRREVTLGPQLKNSGNLNLVAQ
jgi:phage protein D